MHQKSNGETFKLVYELTDVVTKVLFFLEGFDAVSFDLPDAGLDICYFFKRSSPNMT